MTSKKLYVAVAAEMKGLREGRDYPDVHTLDCACLRLARVFKADNPNFDRGRFLDAWGVL